MYKVASRNKQRGREAKATNAKRMSGKRSVKQREHEQRQRVEAMISADIVRIKDPNHLSKLGGWELDRFASVSAKLFCSCRKCGHRTHPESALTFALDHARLSLGTQLLTARKAMSCRKCGAGRLAIGIHIEGAVTWFGGGS